MKYPEGKQEYHDIYPEFNSTHEHMIKHKERSGASAAVMAAVAALTVLATLLDLNLFGRTVITSRLLSATPTTAEVGIYSQPQSNCPSGNVRMPDNGHSLESQ